MTFPSRRHRQPGGPASWTCATSPQAIGGLGIHGAKHDIPRQVPHQQNDSRLELTASLACPPCRGVPPDPAPFRALGPCNGHSVPSFRGRLLAHCSHAFVRGFWQHEFAQYTDRLAIEAVAPIQNKVGTLLSPPVLLNILGQTKSTIDIRSIMDRRQVLIVNLSKGKLGAANAFAGRVSRHCIRPGRRRPCRCSRTHTHRLYSLRRRVLELCNGQLCDDPVGSA